MRHCLLGRGIAHLLERALAKRTAARGQDDFLDRLDAREIKTLPNRVVLAVDRQEGSTMADHFLHHEAAGTDQDFLVRKGDNAAAPNRGERGFETCRPDDAGHYPFRGTFGRLYHCLSATGCLDPGTCQR